jgi:hypothetical protein
VIVAPTGRRPVGGARAHHPLTTSVELKAGQIVTVDWLGIQSTPPRIPRSLLPIERSRPPEMVTALFSRDGCGFFVSAQRIDR